MDKYDQLKDELAEAFAESFMKPDIYFGGFFEVDTTQGIEIVTTGKYGVCGRTCTTAHEALLEYLDGTPFDANGEAEYQEGYLARLSAPGYLDAAEWAAHKTLEDAVAYLIQTYATE